MNKNFKRAMAIQAQNKKKILAVEPEATEASGIYILTRIDENGIKYAYIGQAKHLLTRLAQHLSGYQHIDLSIKKHGLYSKDNFTGWVIETLEMSEDLLNDAEREYIRLFAENGYQLRNKTAGGQDKGKSQIDEYRPAKGYHDGIKQGRKNLARELNHIINKHLAVSIRPEKKNNQTSIRAFEKFKDLLKGCE